ncbi:MAG: carboxypeptidase-like regulatory domain-containing protein [Chitinophagales bacterium]
MIKKVWDEVDTFYNEEPDESRRDNAREWGVVYITIGGPTELSGKITGVNNAVLAGASVLLVQSDAETETDANGDFDMSTTFIGNAVLRISAPGYVTQDKPITIVEGNAMVINAQLVPV